MKLTCSVRVLTSLLLIGFPSLLSAQAIPSGRWDGQISIMSQQLGIRVHFASRGDSLAATIDIPVQNAFGLPLTGVRFAPPVIDFDLPAGPGLATFRGTIYADSIGGRFEQMGMAGIFSLRPARRDTARPAQPPPYESRAVKFSNDTVVLAGTLTVPPGAGPFPGVVLISGSGPQNRDEEIFGFKPFALIADHLTRNGIAVLRFDDRGVGESAGNFAAATTMDFASDAESAMSFLMHQPEIKRGATGLLGHSEGGIAAAVVAARRRDVAFVVLVAAPAITGDSLIDFQVASAVRRAGSPEDEVRRVLALQHRVYETVRKGTGFDTLEALLVEEGKRSLDKLPEQQRAAMASSDSLIRSRVAQQMGALRSGWFRQFITLDPVEYLVRISCPVLALFGEVDKQVPPSLNREPMQRAFARAAIKNKEVRTLPGANHLFLGSDTGDPSEYGTMKKEFVEGFLTAISGWVLSTLAR